MKENDFFKKQSALTSAKTKIYKDYIQGYLPKLLMSYGTCLIADLFCGAGKNGKEDGSPLILIHRLKYILSSPQLQKKDNLKVYILFNDQDKENIENLKIELDKIDYDRNIITIHVHNEKYETLLPDIIRKHDRMKIPKFFFLDPFTYSNVKMQHLKELLHLSNTEVLLFLPIFHSYRFSGLGFDESHKTRIFIEEFTTKGFTDYKNIDDFMFSVREKLLQETSIRYVRPVLLDGGGSKNSLFLLTKHQKGMLFMNKIALKITDDGSHVKVKNQNQTSLFPIKEISPFYDKFKESFVSALHKEDLTNKQIVDFTIRELFLPKHAKEELKELYDLQKIKILDSNNVEIHDMRKWNIAEEIKKETIIKWISHEEK
jgi:three-Cys-motif partner protein